MSDLISRQAAIDAILHNQEVYSNNFGNDPIDRYTIAIIDADAQAIAQLPSAQPEQRWIPCSERLPEHGGWYIVTRRIKKDNDKCVGLLWYSTAHGWEWDNAIAWMPLPEPYREVSK